jgi:hypothetical protein
MRKGPNKYNDTWVKLLGSLFLSHFIEVLGRRESLFELLLKDWYYKGLISGFFIALILWEIIIRITIWLDSRYDWLQKTWPRIFFQVSFGLLLPTVVLYLLTALQMKLLFNQDIVKVEYVLYELPAAAILLVLVNAYYVLYYFYNQISKLSVAPSVKDSDVSDVPTVQPHDENLKKTDIILVNKGLEQLPLPVEKIAFIYKSNDNAFMKTYDGESFLTTYSLEDMEKMLDENSFFRANRQVIVNRKACKSFTSLQFGKLELHLTDPYRDKIIISQKRAPTFREWLLQFNAQ